MDFSVSLGKLKETFSIITGNLSYCLMGKGVESASRPPLCKKIYSSRPIQHVLVGWYGTHNFNFNCTLKKMDYEEKIHLFYDTIKLS